MAIDRLNPKLISVTGASDGDALKYVSANGQIEFGSVSVDTSGITHGLAGANTNIGSAVHGITGANTTITFNKSVADTFGTYANSTFATDTNLDTVSANVGGVIHGLTGANVNVGSAVHGLSGANSTITLNKSVLDTFGTYANSTFVTSSGIVVEGSGGVIDGATANIVFGSGLSATATGTSNTVTVTATSVDIAYSYSSQVFVATGSANTFAMSRSVSNATNMFVAIDGLLQTPEDDYFVSGSTLTIANTTPIVANTEIEARYILSSTSTSNLQNDIFSATGSANTFTLSTTPTDSSSIMVVVGGVLQSPAAPSNNYIVSGTTLTLNNTAAVSSGTVVSVRHLPATS